MRCPQHDGRRARIENSKAAADHGLLIRRIARARAGKVLRECGRGIVGEILVPRVCATTAKCVGATEQSGKEIKDAIEVEIQPKLPTAASLISFPDCSV